FILQVTYPPNPVRHLDDSLTNDQQAGHDFYFDVTSDVVQTCNGCHALNPAAGAFGTDGFSSFENETQDFKIPHLRNLYQKVGMFGMPAVPNFFNSGNNGDQGPQVRGFGFLHDGSTDTLFRFHNATVFNGGFSGDTQRRQVEQVMLPFDSNLAPIIGQQITLDATNGATVGPRIDLMIARAAVGECDVIVKGSLAGQQRGWYRKSPSGLFQSDDNDDPAVSDGALRAQAAVAGQELTYTCVPPSAGARMGVDRDDDGYFDRYEVVHGTDPNDPNSPGGSTTTIVGSTTTTSLPLVSIQTQSLVLRDDSTPPTNPSKRKIVFASSTAHASSANRIVPPAPGSDGDPTLHG